MFSFIFLNKISESNPDNVIPVFHYDSTHQFVVPNFNTQPLNLLSVDFYGAPSNSSASPSPNQQYPSCSYNLPTPPQYNIPVHSPNPNSNNYNVGGGDGTNQFGGGDILNLDNLNIQPQTEAQHLINFPLSESNMHVIDEHMFSNLSIHDNDNDVQETPPSNNLNVSVSNIPPELPVLTFSAMMSSADLDGADGKL